MVFMENKNQSKPMNKEVTDGHDLIKSGLSERNRLQKMTLPGYGSVTLKRFCGESCTNVQASVREIYKDDRITIEVDFDKKEVHLYASAGDMEELWAIVYHKIEFQKKLLKCECLEKSIYVGGPQALIGAGAEVRHVELDNKYCTVHVSHSHVSEVEDDTLLDFLEGVAESNICAITKFTGPSVEIENGSWGRVTFDTPAGASNVASELNPIPFGKGTLRITPCRERFSRNRGVVPFPSVVAEISWPRMYSKGIAVVKCFQKDAAYMRNDFSHIKIGGRPVHVLQRLNFMDHVILTEIDKEICEAEIYQVLTGATSKRILDFYLVRETAVGNPVFAVCEQRILQEFYPFCPQWNAQGSCVRVRVLEPESSDTFMTAKVIFDGSLHLEAARALEKINGKVLPGGLTWQKMHCGKTFQTSLSCVLPVHEVIKDQLDSMVRTLRQQKGVKYVLEEKGHKYYQITISAKGAQVVAELTKPLEQLLKGKIIEHESVTPSVFQALYSRDGELLLSSLQRETKTHIIFDMDNMCLSIFGSGESIGAAERYLVKEMICIHNRVQKNSERSECPICMCEVDHGFILEECGHESCYNCLKRQCDASLRSIDLLPLICSRVGCGASILVTDLKLLFSFDKLDELCMASFRCYMSRSTTYSYCPSPDCPSIYKMAGPDESTECFHCNVCLCETCTKCNSAYHPPRSCHMNRMLLEDPDDSLHMWMEGKDVKLCPSCSRVIERAEGCNHMYCTCGEHLCWVCLMSFASATECYDHLGSVHGTFGDIVLPDNFGDFGDWDA